jgi:hypothetical protein
MCVSSEIIGKSVTCETLSKKVCDLYGEGSDANKYIPDMTVTNGPCFFNGPRESVNLQCVSLASVIWNNCSEIKTNEVVTYGEEKGKICDDAASLFEWPFLCLWSAKSSNEKKSGSCGCIYYFTVNGLK